MPNLVFLSCNKIVGYTESDDLLRSFLTEKGYSIDIKNWDDDVIWKNYDALVFRSTWDYFEREVEFTAFLSKIESEQLLTFNPLHVIKRNIHKYYLRDLENQGVKIVPTLFMDKGSSFDFLEQVPTDWTELVIKPAYSGGAYMTKKVTRKDVMNLDDETISFFKTKDFLIQPFLTEIAEDGEISMLFFNKVYSHSIIKTPKNGDFRVQSQFGGNYASYEPRQSVLDVGHYIVNKEKEDLLYARVDGVVVNGEFYLMEIELIEPDLFMQFSPSGPALFEEALRTLLSKTDVG